MSATRSIDFQVICRDEGSPSASCSAHSAMMNSAACAPEVKESRLQRLVRTVFWEGRSAYDAWLNASSSQVGQVLLTLPMSFAHMGLVSGIVFQIAYGLMGCWACYMSTCLYMNYRDIKEKQGTYDESYDIQWYEVLDGLLGWYWKLVGLFFSIGLLAAKGSINILGASNLAYLLNSNLDKRTWNLVLGSIFMVTVFIPKPQNYRAWSFAGIVMTTYTAWFLTISAATHGQKQDVKHTGPHSYVGYFTGTTNILYAFGGHGLTIELTDAMREVKKFKLVYLYTVLYIWTLTLPSAITVYWAFGDRMFHHPYAFVVFSKSKYRDAAMVLMIIHQFIQFGLSILPIYLMWKKLLGIHASKNYLLKSLARIPIVLLPWFLALMMPFIGLIDSLVGTFFTSFSVYLLPCLAHMVVHRTSHMRKNSIEQPPFWIPSWTGFFCVNLMVVMWISLVGVGFGAWSGSEGLARNVHNWLFAKCYQCTRAV